jgi:aspartate/methionine/tyrosine aminotransferase
VGWALCPPDLVRRAQKLYLTMGVHHPMCAEAFGHLILSRRIIWDRWSSEVRQRINTNRLLVDEFLRGRDDLEWVELAGGVMVFPRIKSDFSATQLADLLRHRYGTFIIPGHFFEDDRHFRLAFGAPAKDLQQGLTHLGSALNELGRAA